MKVIKRVLLVVALVIVVAACVFSFGRQPEPFEQGSASAKMLEAGPHPVAKYTGMLVDKQRFTQANGVVPAKNSRRLNTVIWYPSDNGDVLEGRHPLIIFSHGFSSMKEGGAHIGQHLASHGYLVVAADYPLTSYKAEGGPMMQDVANQPADVSFLIDNLLQWNNSAEHMFFGRIDPERIGATGVSLGGMTTTIVSFHPASHDPRIKAAASIAGPLSMFNADFFSHREIPFMMLATEQDPMVDYRGNARQVLERVKGSQLVTISGGSHTGFSDSGKYLRWLDNPDSLGCREALKRVDTEDYEPWYHLLGTPGQGVIEVTGEEFCAHLPLPPAMNSLRQHMLTKVAILAFFQSQFSDDAEQRREYQHYLSQQMSTELAEVSYEEASSIAGRE